MTDSRDPELRSTIPWSPRSTAAGAGGARSAAIDISDSEDYDPANQSRAVGMRAVLETALRVAPSSASVLITGASGTGKEVVSRLLHEKSGRPPDKFVSVNCAAIAESLIESELFGHERGAFTGADQVHRGKFEWADQGTLLLDEISEIPPQLQAKLLRVIEEQELQRVGSNERIRLNVRILATSNRDLWEEVQADRFRLDLYHRLSVIHLDLPPLRERVEDIPALARHFLRKFRVEGALRPTRIAPRGAQQLLAHDWPGNVRELRNAIHRACLLTDEPTIAEFELIDRRDSAVGAVAPAAASPAAGWGADFASMKLEEVERHVILAALDRCQGNRKAAAQQLGISPRTILNKLTSYGLAGREAG